MTQNQLSESDSICEIFSDRLRSLLSQHHITTRDLHLAIKNAGFSRPSERTLIGYLARKGLDPQNPGINTLEAIVAGFRMLGVEVTESDFLLRHPWKLTNQPGEELPRHNMNHSMITSERHLESAATALQAVFDIDALTPWLENLDRSTINALSTCAILSMNQQLDKPLPEPNVLMSILESLETPTKRYRHCS